MSLVLKRQNIIILSCILLGIVILIITLTRGGGKTQEVSLSELKGDVRRPDDSPKIVSVEKTGQGNSGAQEKPCCRRDENDLLGILELNRKPPPSLVDLEKSLPFVKLGGHWRPESCNSPVKVAIIVPYRNRKDELMILLRHLHPMLNRQHLYYQIFVIEQSEQNAFNKGKLQNIGFKEALKYDNFDCFVFHDVDLIPEDDRNYYGCPTSPQHLSPSLDKFDYKMHSPDLFGGVIAFRKKDFEDVNGFSNSFYGVHGENEDMIERLRRNNKKLHRPILQIGRYSMLQHKNRIEKKEKGHPDMRDPLSHEHVDGLKKLRYKVLHNDRYNLFTFIKVDLLWDKKEQEAF